MPASGRRLMERRTWWTKARVLAGLRRFWRDTGCAPTATEEWQQLTEGGQRDPARRPYPSSYGVLRWFSTFRAAWEAAGVPVDRSYEPWSETEDWYLREGVGVLTRVELAADLRRTPDAVHRRLYDLGLHTYERWGWTPNRVERVAQVPAAVLHRYMAWGALPYLRGTKCLYVDPADLVVVEEIAWDHAPRELVEAATASLRARLVKLLAGQDWRAGRPYQPHQVAGLSRIKRQRRRGGSPAAPKPVEISAGDAVRLATSLPGYERLQGRTGMVQLVFWARMGGAGVARTWRARVEFMDRGAAQRAHATLPLEALQRVSAEAAA